MASVEGPSAQPLKPQRRVPGVYGRSRWFADRLGPRAALERLTQGFEHASGMPDADALATATVAEGLRLLARSGRDPGGIERPVLLDAAGRRLPLEEIGEKEDQVCRVGPPLDLGPFQDEAFLFVPLPSEGRLPGTDLSSTALVHRPGRGDITGGVTVVDAAGVDMATRLLIAKVVEPGRFEAYARPVDPWLVTALRTVDLHWDWIVAEHRLGIGTQLLDRICQVVLCAAPWRDVDPERLARAGVGSPGAWPGLSGNVCDRCLDALGPFVVDRGQVLKPPVLKLLPKWGWWTGTCGWEPIGPTPTAGFGGIGRVSQLVVHPKDPDEVFAAAAGGGIWRSRDGGLHWSPLMSDQPTLTMGALAVAPSNPSIVYAASGEDGGGWNPAWPGVGVYRSANAGGTWQLTTPVPSDRFSAVVVHPTDPATLYVAGNRGLHKSRDGGTTWITNPGQSSLLDGQATDVVLAHDAPDRVYAGLHNSGVWQSLSGGESPGGGTAAFSPLTGPGQLPSGSDAGWTKLAIGSAGAHGSQFLAAKIGPDGGRIFRTVDSGTSWTELAGAVAAVGYDEWCSVIAVSPDDENTLLAGAVGLSRTTNGGATAADWAGIAGVHADQQDIAFSPTSPQTGYLANDGGVYRTTDGGQSWTFRSGGLQITQFYDISASARDAGVLAGGAQDNGVYYRASSGTWRHIPWGDGTGVAIDPTDPRIVYFSSQNGVPNWLRRSVDGGQTHQGLSTAGLSGGSPWVTLIKLDPTDPVADPANNRVLFVCGHTELFRSTTGGQSWQRVADQAGTPFTTQGTITSLEFARSAPGVLYLGTSLGFVYRAQGGGATAVDWTLLSPPGTPNEAMFPDVPIQSIGIDPSDPDHVWVAFTGLGVTFSGRWGLTNPLGVSHVYRSTDGGATWQDASGRFTGLNLPDVPTSAVALHPTNRGTVYVGTDVGVFRTTTSGQTWSADSHNLPRSPVTDLTVGRGRLFAATMGRGVYFRDL
ncbi:hypothetical protein OG426_09635 [Streptomyces canus]|uniref:WD40/YVTN/BNR-like repeat-containing protein n=1 Tax=Streptomyces canus TaxID=58343 RepID=UPI00386A35C7|nr:hypothetical protein OG426_09635 [Streptomyces canus]